MSEQDELALHTLAQEKERQAAEELLWADTHLSVWDEVEAQRCLERRWGLLAEAEQLRQEAGQMQCRRIFGE